MKPTVLRVARALPATVAALSLTPAIAAGQGQPYMELLRSDIQKDKVAIMTEAMMLNEEQGEAFWPLYREYQLDLSRIGDRRVALIKDFAENYQTMTLDKSKKIADDWFKQQEDRIRLYKKYYREVEKKLNSTLAARFIQIENQLNLLLDIQIASEVPLIKRPG